MEMSSGTMATSTTMSMTFFTAYTTPLYSLSWSPTTTSGYAATCLFLVLLGTLFRGLLAAKAWKESAWLDAEFERRYVVVAGKGSAAERLVEKDSSDGDSDKTAATKRTMLLSENGVEEDVVVVQKRRGSGVGSRPWRLSVDPVRAVMDTVIAGVAYLLMLAVMTMNVGYFMAVLGGTFLGSLAVGRYAVAFEHDH